MTDQLIIASALNDVHLKSLVDSILRFYKKNKAEAFQELTILAHLVSQNRAG